MRSFLDCKMALSWTTDAADVSIAVANRSPFSSTVSALIKSMRLRLLGTLIWMCEPGALGMMTEGPAAAAVAVEAADGGNGTEAAAASVPFEEKKGDVKAGAEDEGAGAFLISSSALNAFACRTISLIPESSELACCSSISRNRLLLDGPTTTVDRFCGRRCSGQLEKWNTHLTLFPAHTNPLCCMTASI